MIKKMIVSSGPDLRVDPVDGVLWVTLHRPDRLNALNGAIRDQLEALLPAVGLKLSDEELAMLTEASS